MFEADVAFNSISFVPSNVNICYIVQKLTEVEYRQGDCLIKQLLLFQESNTGWKQLTSGWLAIITFQMINVDVVVHYSAHIQAT
jgi:hypothetical protein